jgi:hypothetical protein
MNGHNHSDQERTEISANIGEKETSRGKDCKSAGILQQPNPVEQRIQIKEGRQRAAARENDAPLSI